MPVNKTIDTLLARVTPRLYLFAGSVTFFVLLSLIYLNLRQPTFQVTAVIPIQKGKASPVISQPVINNLLFKAIVNSFSYQFVTGPKAGEHLNNQSAPPVVLSVYNVNSPRVLVKITIVNKFIFKLSENNVSQLYGFGELVQRPYASFRLNSNTASQRGLSCLIKFSNTDSLYRQVMPDVMVLPEKSSGVLVFSIRTGNIQKGKTILQGMITAYVNEHLNEFAESKSPQTTDSLAAAKYVSSTPKDKIAQVKNQKLSPGIRPVADAKQIAIYKEIKPYLYGDLDKYELLPDTYPIADPQLKEDITAFNKMETERQTLLSNHKPQDTLVLNFSNNITRIRTAIAERIKSNEKLTKKNVVVYKLSDNYQSHKNASMFDSEKVANSATELPIIQFIIETEHFIDVFFLFFAVFLGLLTPLPFLWLNNELKSVIGNIIEIKTITTIPSFGCSYEVKSDSNLKDVSNQSQEPVYKAVSQFAKYIDSGPNIFSVSSNDRQEGKTQFAMYLAQYLSSQQKTLFINLDLGGPDLSLLLQLQKMQPPTVASYKTYTIFNLIEPTGLTPGLFVLDSNKLIRWAATRQIEKTSFEIDQDNLTFENADNKYLHHILNEKLLDCLKNEFYNVILLLQPFENLRTFDTFTRLCNLNVIVVKKNHTGKDFVKKINQKWERNLIDNPFIVLTSDINAV